MAKSNEKFRSNLVKEMRDKYNERNKKLEQVEGSSFSDGLKEQMKKEIMDNFNQEMEEMKTRPWYEEARKTHLEEVKAKIKLTKSKKEKKRLQKGYEDMKERLRREYEKKLEEAKADVENSQEEYEDMEERLRREYEKKLREYEKKLEEAEADMENSQVEYEDAQMAHKYVQTAHGWEVEYEKIFWNEKAILKNLKEHYVRKDEAEVMWYKWKIVHVNLPAVWNFEWFNFDYFVSYARVHKDDFEANPEFEKKSYSMKKICDILKAMNRYLAELGVKTDGNKNYENDLQWWNWKSMLWWIVHYFPTESKAWDWLKDVTWLNRAYWTSDKKVYRKEDSRIRWDCTYDAACFRNDDETVSHCLFLRLYD